MTVAAESMTGTRRSRRRSGTMNPAGRLILYVILVLSAVLFAFPFYWTFVGSLMTPVEIYSSIPHLWPSHPDFGNYARVFQLVPMARYFLNSIITSVATMVVATIVASMAGYCFAQLRFMGKAFWFVLTLATLMVPYQARLIPLFVMFTQYGLYDTYLGIILPGLASALGVFMMTQFFKGIPSELREAALIDGAGEPGVFFRVYLPLARAGVSTLAVLMFVQAWEQLLWPLIIAPKPEMRTLQVGLAYLGQSLPTLNYQMAAIVISVVPILVAFFLAQRQFVEGIAAGAVKQ